MPSGCGTGSHPLRLQAPLAAVTLDRPGACASIAARVEEQTPTKRDRYLDFLRVAAILMVVLGHWVVRVVRVVVAPGDEPEAQYLLAE